MRRIPAARQRQGDREARARHAEHHTHEQGGLVIFQPDQPRDREAHNDDELREDAGGLGADAVHEQAEQEPDETAGEDRHGDHEEALLRREVQRVGRGDLVRQHAEQRPHHEAVIEIEERGNQRRPVPGGFEFRKFHRRAGAAHAMCQPLPPTGMSAMKYFRGDNEAAGLMAFVRPLLGIPLLWQFTQRADFAAARCRSCGAASRRPVVNFAQRGEKRGAADDSPQAPGRQRIIRPAGKVFGSRFRSSADGVRCQRRRASRNFRARARRSAS